MQSNRLEGNTEDVASSRMAFSNIDWFEYWVSYTTPLLCATGRYNSPNTIIALRIHRSWSHNTPQCAPRSLQSGNNNTWRKHCDWLSGSVKIPTLRLWHATNALPANSPLLLVFWRNGSPRPEPDTEGRLGEPCLLGPFHEAPSLFWRQPDEQEENSSQMIIKHCYLPFGFL